MSDLIERLENGIELFRRYESCLPLADRGLCNWRIRVALPEADEILSALKTVRGIDELQCRVELAATENTRATAKLNDEIAVIGDQHAYGDQEVYYGVLTETNFVEGEQSVIKLVACVSEESVYLSDNHGNLRDLDEFDFVVGPFVK